MEYFPNNRGLITGIIESSYGFGSFIFNLIATEFINPSGEAADIKTSDPNLNIFKSSIANRVPLLLRSLCFAWSCLVLSSAVLISIPEKKKETTASLTASEGDDEIDEMENENQELREDSKQMNLVRPYACFASRRFWQYFTMMFLANIFGGFFSY